MSKTIKIIDLLNKIANGEEVPEKIMYNDKTFRLNQITGWYQNIDVIGNVEDWFISKYRLNDKVEIIEEQEEIDIQDIKELDFSASPLAKTNLLNELVQAVKQLDLKVKEK